MFFSVLCREAFIGAVSFCGRNKAFQACFDGEESSFNQLAGTFQATFPPQLTALVTPSTARRGALAPNLKIIGNRLGTLVSQ